MADLGTGNPQSSEVRPAQLSDVEFLVEVVIAATRHQGRWPADRDEAEFRRQYTSWTTAHVHGEDPQSVTSVIEVAGDRAGRLRVVRNGQCVELAGIQLHPSVQGRGIGTAIIEDLKSEAAGAGLPLELSVEHDNPRARALYERLDFIAIGTDSDETRLRWQQDQSIS